MCQVVRRTDSAATRRVCGASRSRTPRNPLSTSFTTRRSVALCHARSARRRGLEAVRPWRPATTPPSAHGDAARGRYHRTRHFPKPSWMHAAACRYSPVRVRLSPCLRRPDYLRMCSTCARPSRRFLQLMRRDRTTVLRASGCRSTHRMRKPFLRLQPANVRLQIRPMVLAPIFGCKKPCKNHCNTCSKARSTPRQVVPPGRLIARCSSAL